MSTLADLIRNAGGLVEDGFVKRPAIKLLASTALSGETSSFLDSLGIFEAAQDYERLAEFNSRLTYINFPSQGSPDYMQRIRGVGHLSVYSSWSATFLLAGVSTECVLELVAHGEATVSRLTTSRTKAQDSPLFVEPPEAYRSLLQELRQQVSNESPAKRLDEKEARNKLYSGYKAGALTYTMNLKDYHKLFIGRPSHKGVEKELRQVCEGMCEILHEKYPNIIAAIEDYYGKENSEKYETE